MARFTCIRTLLLTALLAFPAGAADMLTYAEEDGTIRTVPVMLVSKDTDEELSARVILGGRPKRIRLSSRQVIAFRRGDAEDENQWSKMLANGKRLMAAGQLETRGTVPGAEEIFTKVTYSRETGTPGQEKTEAISPWQNMYGLYYLIECRLAIGSPEKLQLALANVEEFRKRTEGKYGKKIKWEVPAQEGTTTADVYCWGDNRLGTEIAVFEAEILSKLGRADEARKTYEAVIDDIKKRKLSPILLVRAIESVAEIDAAGQPSEQQEDIYRAAGTTLAGLGKNQPDAFGKATLARAANRALLRGADLLLDSAREGKVSYDLPLSRYRALKEAEGRTDPALAIGAQAGIGICLTEKGQGKEAYEALLDVATTGQEYPEQMARALFYLGRAAPLYADAIEKEGGSGAFLREEGPRWLRDLRDRYPGSDWSEKATDK